MKILMVEDDTNKQERLLSFLKRQEIDIQIECAASYHSAVRKVQDTQFDLVLLDMTIPTFDITIEEPGGDVEGYGGREFLEEADRLGLRVPVIVVTQFDRFGDPGTEITLAELDQQLAAEFPIIYQGAVFYSSAREGWQHDLSLKIARVQKGLL